MSVNSQRKYWMKQRQDTFQILQFFTDVNGLNGFLFQVVLPATSAVLGMPIPCSQLYTTDSDCLQHLQYFRFSELQASLQLTHTMSTWGLHSGSLPPDTWTQQACWVSLTTGMLLPYLTLGIIHDSSTKLDFQCGINSTTLELYLQQT